VITDVEGSVLARILIHLSEKNLVEGKVRIPERMKMKK
jgi:hypothetical protein